jgi:hypothetical protein
MIVCQILTGIKLIIDIAYILVSQIVKAMEILSNYENKK